MSAPTARVSLPPRVSESMFSFTPPSWPLVAVAALGTAASVRCRSLSIWTPADGIRPLKDVLLEQGAPVSEWSVKWAADLSADGKTIIGTADIPGVGSDIGWLAMLL